MEQINGKQVNKDITAAVISSDIPVVPTDQKVTENTTKKYIRFGSDNLFPQQLASLERQALVKLPDAR